MIRWSSRLSRWMQAGSIERSNKLLGVDGCESLSSVKHSVDVQKYNRPFHLVQLHTQREVSDECIETGVNAIVLNDSAPGVKST